MPQMTYQVFLSSDGKHTIVVTGDNQAEMQAGTAWAKATYEAIVGRYGHKGASKAAVQDTRSEDEAQEIPICQIHQVPMVLVKGKKGPFWSCHEKTNGEWCNQTEQYQVA